MSHDAQTIKVLYKKLLTFYPQEFREQLAESMEQTFHDLCYEKRQARKGYFRSVLWVFVETAIGIFRERLVLITKGDRMQTALGSLGSLGGISFLIILPFMIMEVVNRRNFNEDFPFILFFVLWLNLFAVNLILLPIVQAGRTGNQDLANPVATQGIFTNPKSALMTSLFLILLIVILFLLSSIGWEPLERLMNGPNPEVAYLPGQVIAILLILIPIAAGIIAGGPIVRTLRTGGSLFAHPFHLIIVVVISLLFAASVVGLIADQWSCFMGVQFCD